MLKILKGFILPINLIVIIALLLIHFVLKENSHFFSILYYTFPLPLIIFAIVLFSVIQSKKIRTYNLILALLLTVIWFSRSFKINMPEIIKASDIEIVFWNATHKREFKHVFEEVENIPDIVVLVEYHAEELTQIKSKYPDNFFYWHAESEIGIFSKTSIHIKEIAISEDETVVLNFITCNINFYAIDVSPSMKIYREQQLKFINESVKTVENAILLGDFNTPFESRFFNDIRINFNQVLTEKGNGFRETWFWNIPLLSLDHIWISKDLEIINAEKISTFKSDHSMIRTVVRKK